MDRDVHQLDAGSGQEPDDSEQDESQKIPFLCNCQIMKGMEKQISNCDSAQSQCEQSGSAIKQQRRRHDGQHEEQKRVAIQLGPKPQV